MSTLANCIRKANKALSARDAQTLRDSQAEMLADGMGSQQAAETAIRELQRLLAGEYNSLLKDAETQGADIRGFGPMVARFNRPTSDDAARIGRALAMNDYMPSQAQLEEARRLMDGGMPRDDAIRKVGLKVLPVKSETIAGIAEALSAVQAERLRELGIDLTGNTAQNAEYLAHTVSQEAMREFFEVDDNAFTWYSDSVGDTMAIMELIHPELRTDLDAQTAYKFAIAITSNGTGVPENLAIGDRMYEYFKRHGRFPTDPKTVNGGKETNAMIKAFRVYNQLRTEMGPERLRKFMMTQFTAGQLNNVFDQGVSGELAESAMYGSAIFGPKIGQGFFQNLMGVFDPLTMDRWFMRTWHRMRGTFKPKGGGDLVGQRARFLDAVKKYQADAEKVWGEPIDLEELETNDDYAADIARKVLSNYTKGNFTERTELNRAGQRWAEGLKSLPESPQNGSERSFIRGAFQRALDLLSQNNISTDMATLQAIIWFPEKRLYRLYNVGSKKSDPTDYKTEAIKYVQAKGHTDADVRRAVRRAAERRAAIARRRAGTSGAASDEGGITAPYDEREKAYVLANAALRQVRQLANAAPDQRAYQQRKVGGDVGKALKAVSLARWEVQPGRRPANLMTAAGLDRQTYLELAPGADVAEQFFAKHAGVPAEQLSTARLFISPEGTHGFALESGEIKHVFKEKANTSKGAEIAALLLGVQHGASIYEAPSEDAAILAATVGFRPVAKLGSGYMMAHAPGSDGTFDPSGVRTYTNRSSAERAARKQATEAQLAAPSIRFSLRPETAEDLDANPSSERSRLAKLGLTAEEITARGAEPRGLIQSLVDSLEKPADLARTGVMALTPRRYYADYLPKDSPARIPMKKYLRDAQRMDARAASLQQRWDGTLKSWLSWSRKDRAKASLLGDVMHGATLFQIDPSVPYKAKENIEELEKKIEAVKNRMRARKQGTEKDYARIRRLEGRIQAEQIREKQHRILRKGYMDLGTEGQRTFNQVRADYASLRSMQYDALVERIKASDATAAAKNELIQDLDQLRLRFEHGRMPQVKEGDDTGEVIKGDFRTLDVYFPLARFGKHWAYVKDPETDQVLAFSKFESKRDRRAWVKAMSDQYGRDAVHVGDDRISERGDMLRQMDPRFVQRVEAQLKAQTTTDAEGNEKLDPKAAAILETLWSVYLQSLPEMSVRKRFIPRKGRMGYSANAIRAYADHMFHGSKQLARLENVYLMEESLARVQKAANELVAQAAKGEVAESDAEWAVAVVREARAAHEWAMNPEGSPMAAKLTTLGFVWYLSATPAAAMVNLTQTPIVGGPVLAAEFGWGETTKHLLSAAWDVLTTKGDVRNRLRGDELRAFSDLADSGTFEKTFAHDMLGLATGSTPWSFQMERMLHIVSFLFHGAEKLNREITALAAYRAARAKKMSHDAAVTLADNLTYDSHFDYSNANRARILRGDVAKVALLFRQYSLNMTYRLMRDGREMFKDKKARHRFFGVLANTMLFAGARGLPLYWLFTELAEIFLAWSDDDEEDDTYYDADWLLEQSLSETFGRAGAAVLLNGGVDGMDSVLGSAPSLSSRVSLNNLWIRETPPGLDGQNLGLYALGQLAGPIGGLGVDLFEGASRISDGHVQQGLEKMVPKFGRDWSRTARYATEGVENLAGGTIVAPEDVSGWDLFYQGIGFAPVSVNEAYRVNRRVTGEKQFLEERQQLIKRMFITADENDDPELKAEAIRRMQAYNATNPDFKMSFKGVLLQYRRQQNAMEQYGGIPLSKKYRELSDKYNPTDE